MSKQSDLVALANQVRDFIDQETCTAAQWNVNVTLLETSLNLIGADFADTDSQVAAITTKYNANHKADGSHDITKTAPEWVPDPAVPTFISASTFTLPGDRSTDYRVGDRLRIHQGAGGTTLVICAVLSVSFASGPNTTTLIVRSSTSTAPLISTLASIDRSLVKDAIRRIGGFDLLDGAIDNARIFTDGVVTLAKLAGGSVDQTKLVDGSVVTGKLGPAAVVAANVAANAIGTTAIQSLSIIGAKIANATLNGTKFQFNSVHGDVIQDNTIKNEKLEPASVDGFNIVPGAVSTTELGDTSVTTQKLVDEAVTPAKRAKEWFGAPTGNFQAAAVVVQRGWAFVNVADPGKVQERAVTFPQPFGQLYHLRVTPVGVKAGADPTFPFDIDNSRYSGTDQQNLASLLMAQPKAGVSLSAFTALLGFNSISQAQHTIVANDRLVFMWEAVGTLP